MFKLDNDFLTSLGLGGLPVEEKNKLLQMIYERLEMNVGMRLAEKMTDQQLDEFEAFIDQNDEAGALKWLETNFPTYKDVVAEELEKLKVEVTQVAPQILAAQGGGQAPPIMTDPMMPGVPQPVHMPQNTSLQQQPASSPVQQQPAFQPQAPVMQQPMYDQPMQQPQPMPMPAPMSPTPDYVQQPAPQQFAPAIPAQPQPIPQPLQPEPFLPYPAQPPQPVPGFAQPQQPTQSQQFTPPPNFTHNQ